MKGIDPQSLEAFDLHLAEDPKRPEVLNAAERFLAEYPKYSELYRVGRSDFDNSFGRIPLEYLEAVFTPEENMRLWWGSMFECKYGRRIKDSLEADRTIFKISSSMWRWGHKKDWNQLVRVLDGIRRFTLGNDLDLRLDFASGYNEKGYCVFHRTERDGLPKGGNMYLDGSMGFVIYRKGKPVGVIGFSVVAEGVLFQQVQTIKPKGNRWLYKLDRPLFELTANAMHEAFSDCGGLYIVDGASAADAVRQAYGEDAGSLKPEITDRIQARYDQPLPGLVRGESRTANGTEFHKLEAA